MLIPGSPYYESELVHQYAGISTEICNSMEQSSSWEVNNCLTYFKFYCRVPNIPPVTSNVHQMDPIYNLKSHFVKIYFNIILLPTHISPKLSIHFRVSD
jgi:hypothetical protein